MLPQYEIMEILGRGGMGAVYKGRQKSLKRLVAIKILPLDAADDEMKFVERFQNEAQTMAAMNHPAIVSVYDFGETPDGLLYFIMEYVDGTDVQKMIQASGKLSGDYALAITAHVCDALSYAHKRGVIHRDIKPANILIDQEGHIKVADFGLAKMDDPSMTSGLTKSNMAMGTPDYVAPEVLTAGMVADHRADLYAVGVMLYQMLTGEVPRGMFKLPSQKGIGSDPRFDEIICKAMEQDRDERYQSAGDLRRALDVILTTPQAKSEGTGVVKAIDIPLKPMAKGSSPPGETNAAKQAPPRQAASSKTKAPPKKRSSATSTWLGIGGIAALLVVSGVVWMKGNPTPSSEAPTGVSQTEALFDGLTFSGWRTTNGTEPEASWRVEAGRLMSSKISVLRTVEEFGDCEFDFEWRVGAGGNGGVFYHVLGDHLAAPELQLCDPANSGNTPSGGLFGVVQPLSDASKPIGEWNTGRLVVRGSLSEHWINGQKVCAYDTASADFRAKLAASKFAGKPQFGAGSRGALALQSNGGEVAYRNLRIQRSNAKPAVKTVPDVLWTDWLGPRLAKGQFANKPDLVVEKDGITSNQLVTSIRFDEGTVVRGPVRMTYLLRESEWTQVVFSINPLTNETYRAEDKGSELRLFRCGKDGANQMMLASENIPAAISRTAERTLEFAVDGNVLRATVNGTFSLSAQDATLATESGSFHSIAFKKGLLLKKVEIAAEGAQGIGTSKGGAAGSSPAASTIPWTDWMGSSFARGQFRQSGFVAEKDGITTDQESRGVTLMEDHALEGPVRLTYQLRDSKGAKIIFRNLLSRDMYVAEDSGIELNVYRVGDGGIKKTMLASEKYPATLSRTGDRTLEFRVEGDALKATVNGTFSLSARDATLTAGPGSFGGVDFRKGLLLKKVEIATDGVSGNRISAGSATPPRPATAWTDWLTPKLASGTFDGGQWKREPEGFTTGQSIAGYEVLPAATRDGAMRVTFALRGSEGVMINVRDTKVGNGSHQYTAQYTGTSLYIAHASSRLITEPMPKELRDRPDHTLEFRFEGENLIAILNDTHRITARHSQLTEGRCALVLTKGVLVKKIEVQTLSPP